MPEFCIESELVIHELKCAYSQLPVYFYMPVNCIEVGEHGSLGIILWACVFCLNAVI